MENKVHGNDFEKKVPLLEMKNITKIFPGVIALDQVNLTINQGEVHLLLGENGAGKSTMIKTIIGINKPDAGDMYWLGEKMNIHRIQEAYDLGIAVIYQELSNIPCLSIVENMFLGRELKKRGIIDWKNEKKQAKKALERVGLKGIDIEESMENLGMGQRQLVEIARAIDRKAKLIIMDEPTSSLSRKEIDWLLDLIIKLNKQGISILFITHKLDEAKKVGHVVTVLKDGKNSGGTIDATTITEDEIIRLMVAREVTEKYPKRKVEIRKENFRCENLCSDKFEDISFEVKEGELLGIFGLIGSGRTETMRAIFGADPLVSGNIYISGEKIRIKNPRDAIQKGIVLITENRKEEGLILNHSVIENGTIVTLKEFKNSFGFINNEKRRIAVEEKGKKLNLRPLHLEKNTIDFSGGNQQKIVILKWLLTKTKIFIFDEPTKGVDVGAKVEIYTIMNNLLKEGASIIMVSSEIPEIMGMSDRIMTMNEGIQTAIINNDENVTEELILTLATGGKING